jgi:hypothetical protein
LTIVPSLLAVLAVKPAGPHIKVSGKALSPALKVVFLTSIQLLLCSLDLDLDLNLDLEIIATAASEPSFSRLQSPRSPSDRHLYLTNDFPMSTCPHDPLLSDSSSMRQALFLFNSAVGPSSTAAMATAQATR